MGTTLTGTTPATTYDSLIKVTDNGPLSATAKYLSDGLGNDSSLALSTGNIGIGTSSPTNLVMITKSSNSGSGSSFPRLSVANTLATQGDGSSTFNFADINVSSGDGAVNMFVATTYAAGTWAPAAQLNVASNHPLIVKTNNTEVARFTEGGNVGIGTANAGVKLDIVGSGTLSGTAGYTLRATQDQTNFRGVVLGYDTSGQIGIIYPETGGPASSLAFWTNNGSTWGERARITSDGLTFNGDTAAANALDDYEEGTWTGTLTPSTSGSIAVSAGTQPFGYTKIGRQVTLTGLAIVQSVSSPVGLRALLGNIPFTVGSSDSSRAGGAVTYFDASASYAFTAVNGYATPSATSLYINIDTSVLAAGDEFAFTFTYFV